MKQTGKSLKEDFWKIESDILTDSTNLEHQHQQKWAFSSRLYFKCPNETCTVTQTQLSIMIDNTVLNWKYVDPVKFVVVLQ